MTHLYFDNNADAPILPEAWQAYQIGTSKIGNPTSSHALGTDAKSALDDAQARLKSILHGDGYDLYWTSGGTESDAMVLKGTGIDEVYIGAAEHSAVIENDLSAYPIAMGADGRYRLEGITDEHITQRLVCLSLANSETGVIQPIQEFTEQLRSRGPVWIHCDGVQAAGRLPIDLERLDVDSFAIAAHKFGGVPGIGALFVKSDKSLKPGLLGGGQQGGVRPGTLQLAGPLAMVAALEAWTTERRQSLKTLRDDLEARVREIDGVSIVAGQSERLPNTSALRVAGCSGDALLMGLDIEKLSISTGSACSSGAIEPSKTLLAMGMSPQEAREVIRVSLGFEHHKTDILKFVETLRTVVERARLFG